MTDHDAGRSPLNSGDNPMEVIRRIIICTVLTVAVVVILYFSGMI